MDSFSIRFEWEQSPGARVAEHDATWARLEIRAADEPITRVEVTRTESLRTAIYVPLYPLAEWIASNWWPLWEEWGTSQSRARHCLLAAKEGFALPDLTIAPTETKVRLVWRPSACLTEGIAFLSAGECVLDKLMVKEQFRALVDAVLERLELRGAPDLRLAQYWRTVQDSEGDPEQRAFQRSPIHGWNDSRKGRGVRAGTRCGRTKQAPDAVIRCSLPLASRAHGKCATAPAPKSRPASRAGRPSACARGRCPGAANETDATTEKVRSDRTGDRSPAS